MIFNQATFQSLDLIPEAYPTTSPRDEFEQVNGVWQLKETAIPGVGPLFNKALEDNKNRAMDQLKNAERERDTHKLRVTELERNSNLPAGSVVLSGEDAKNWERFTKLGAIKDVEKAVTEFPKLQEKLVQQEKSTDLVSLAEKAGLNAGVIIDLANSEAGKGLTFSIRDVDGVDAKKQPVKIPTIYVKVESPGAGGKVEVSEKALLDYAKETFTGMQEWKYTALTTPVKTDANNNGTTTTTTVAQPVLGGVSIPNTSSAAAGAGGGEAEKGKALEKFQKERDSSPSPFDPPVTAK